MEISWKNLDGSRITAAIPSNLWPFVDAIGIDETAKLLLEVRGKFLHVGSKKVSNRSIVGRLLGHDMATKLFESLSDAGYGQAHGKSFRVPTATVFLSRYLCSQGLKNAEIAVRLGTTDVTVRHNLKSDEERHRLSEKLRAKRLEEAILDAVALGMVVRVEQPKQKAAR